MVRAQVDPGESNPRLSPWVRVFFAVVAFIVLFGSGLYFLPGVVVPQWFWPLTPFNANFMGAVYLSELITVIVLLQNNRWAPARVVFPMSYVFTGVVTLVSFFHLDRFDFSQWSGYFWFAIYIGSVLIVASFHLYYRKLPVSNPIALPKGLRNYLAAQGVILVAYGLYMLLLPALATGFWPWRIDDFHGRVYSALPWTVGVGTLLVARSAALLDLRLLGVVQTVVGLLPVLGLIVVNMSQQRVDWLSPGTLLWLAGFGSVLATGLYMLRLSFAPREMSILSALPTGGASD